MKTEYMKGFTLTALGVLVLSFDALLIRLIHSESFDLLFWRGILLSVAVLIWCRIRKPDQPLFSFDAAFIRSAVLFAVNAIFFVSAVNLTSVANVLVIICAQPLFAAIMSRIFLGEKSPPITWIAIVICMGAIFWVLAGSWNSPSLLGDFLALGVALMLAGKFVNDRACSHRDMTPALIMSGLMIAAVSLVLGSPFSLQGAAWGWMVLLCFVVVPLAFILITLGPTRIPAAEVGMLMLLETATGPLWTWIFLDEVPSTQAIQGGVVVITTLLIHGVFQWRRNKRLAASVPSSE